jgi:hypothetical protein
VIANKKELNITKLIQFFATHTLSDCAAEFNCSVATVKRRLRIAGVDTSIHNHTPLARSKHPNRKYVLSDAELEKLFIEQNLDSKTIAETIEPPVHYNVIRKHIKRLGLKKTRQQISKSMQARHLRLHGVLAPAQRPDVLEKTRRSTIRAEYTAVNGTKYLFRSLHELSYAMLLDKLGLEWYYEEMWVPYVDMLTGKQRLYIIDFTVVWPDKIEWIEVKPNRVLVPDDKRIYASRRAEEAGVIFRKSSSDELSAGMDLLKTGWRTEAVEFRWPPPKAAATQVTYYFKTINEAVGFTLGKWRATPPRKLGSDLYSVRYVR